MLTPLTDALNSVKFFVMNPRISSSVESHRSQRTTNDPLRLLRPLVLHIQPGRKFWPKFTSSVSFQCPSVHHHYAQCHWSSSSSSRVEAAGDLTGSLSIIPGIVFVFFGLVAEYCWHSVEHTPFKFQDATQASSELVEWSSSWPCPGLPGTVGGTLPCHHVSRCRSV